MRSSFREYYEPADPNALLRSAIIVIDTNVLLDLYRSSEAIAEELLMLFEAIKNQLWLPYQIGFEYHENLERVLSEIRLSKASLVDNLKAIIGNVEVELIKLGDPSVLRLVDEMRKQVHAGRGKSDLLAATFDEQALSVRARIESLFAPERVGRQFTNDEMITLIKEGHDRYDKRIPPGFRDAKKDGATRVFGDLIIWKQIIEESKRSSKPAILVTNDSKEDWWRSVKGRKLGPLPALRAEMYSLAGQEFYIYSSDQFLKYAAPLFLKREADKVVLKDVTRANKAEDLRQQSERASELIANLSHASKMPSLKSVAYDAAFLAQITKPYNISRLAKQSAEYMASISALREVPSLVNQLHLYRPLLSQQAFLDYVSTIAQITGRSRATILNSINSLPSEEDLDSNIEVTKTIETPSPTAALLETGTGGGDVLSKDHEVVSARPKGVGRSDLDAKELKTVKSVRKRQQK